jgi:hypothetical protein
MGSKGGPFLGNLGAPVVATPALLGSLQLYQQLKDPKFLSKNVYAVDNENVAKLDRIAEGQKGDTWVSTVKDNEVTSKEPVPYTSTAGSSDTTFDQPKTDAAIAATQSTTAKQPDPKPTPKQNPDVDVIIELLTIKNYKIYEDINKLNIVAIRTQCQSIGDKYSDQFVDKLYVMFKKEDNTWELKQYMFSTVPGLEFTISDSWLKEKNLDKLNPWIGSSGKKIFMKEYARTAGTINGDPTLKNGLPILVPSQYVDVYYLSQYRGAKAFLTINGATQLVWRDSDTDNPDTFNPRNFTAPELITPNALIDNGIKVHLGYPGGKNVGNWSEGSQVFSNADSLNEFFRYCEKHKEKYDNKFTYTLATKNDWDEATKNVDANKAANTLSPTQSQVSNTTGTQSETGQSTNTNQGGTQSQPGSSGTSGSSGSSGTSGTPNQPTNTNSNEFTIGILNPTSQGSKNVTGKITISKRGPQYTATGVMSGFPDGSSIGPISGAPYSSSDGSTDALVNEMLIILENTIISTYQVQVKLVVLDKK